MNAPAARILAIGDVHGCLSALHPLLAAVAPTSQDTLITLGDYVDRGPDSAGVITTILRLRRSCRVISLLGNHEAMMLAARKGGAKLENWLECGGDATLRSYAVLGDAGCLADVPDDHWTFLDKECVSWHEAQTHFFVHANAYAEMPLDEQPEYMLRWEKFNDPPPHESGKVMVCGHSPQHDGRPRNIGHAVCIDTHVYGDFGWLTCLDTTSGRIWQANRAGKTRRAWLEDFLEVG